METIALIQGLSVAYDYALETNEQGALDGVELIDSGKYRYLGTGSVLLVGGKDYRSKMKLHFFKLK